LPAGPTLIKKKLKSEKELKNAQSLVFGFSGLPAGPTLTNQSFGVPHVQGVVHHSVSGEALLLT
jgi:hypothetical protein